MLESARQNKEDVAAVASVSADISEYVTALAVTLAERAKEESLVADVSRRISVAGVVAIACGLSAQVVGIALAEIIHPSAVAGL